MSRLLKVILLLAVLVAIGTGLELTVLDSQRLEVKVVAVARGRVLRTVTSTSAGTVVARREALVSVERPGRVASRLVAEGAEVEAGAPVLRLDAAEAEADLARTERAIERARAEVARAEATLAGAEDDLRRSETLLAAHAGTEERVTAHRTAVAVRRREAEVARLLIAELAAARDLARVRLRQTEVRAPFAGTVIDVLAEEGEFLAPGAPAFDLRDLRELHVEAPIDEVDVPALVLGQCVIVTLEVATEDQVAGALRALHAAVSSREERNRTCKVEVAFAEPPSGLRPGMSADVEIVTGAVEDALHIPSHAILERGERRLVWVVAPDGRLERREIECGLANWDVTEVTAGLEEGERVVVTVDVKGLEDGVPVRAREDD